MNLRLYRAIVILAIALTAPASWAQPAPFAEAVDGSDTASYWLRNREGWFWYRDPPENATDVMPAAPVDNRPRELIEFEAMQKRLEDLKRVAVMNPTETHMKAYMRYQRLVMDKSAVFADSWQRLVWKTPDLDYSLTGRPTNNFAIDVYDAQLRDKQTETIRALAKTHGLFFFFRGNCAYCHKLAPILKRFEVDYGIPVFPVSLDGGGLPDYPRPLLDNGIATNLNVSVVPAVFLAIPGSREITPIGYGLMASDELVDRIYTITQTKPGQPF